MASAMPDPARAQTRGEFAECLRAWRKWSGMTLETIESAVGKLPPRRTRDISFKRSSLSEVFTGKHLPKRDLLTVLLEVMRVPAVEMLELMDAWQRIDVGRSRPPTDAIRVVDYPARLLGVQAAIPVPGWPDAIPAYVKRDFDRRLQELLKAGGRYGSFVILTGSQSVGKTRSLYEAIKAAVPDWWLIHPSGRRALANLAESMPARTVIWLDCLETYLEGEGPPLNLPLMSQLRGRGVIVVATMSSPTFRQRKELPAYAADRQLIESAAAIPVSPTFSETERRNAEKLAVDDIQLRIALSVTDMGVIQTLTGGPALVDWWERQENPAAWAAVTAAADLYRLGLHQPLSAEAIESAFTEYLEPQELLPGVTAVLALAIGEATRKLQGVSAPLTLVGNGGTAYKVSEFLLQYVCRRRRQRQLPQAIWDTAVAHVKDPDDLRRTAASAEAMMRYRYAHHFLRQLTQGGGIAETIQLAGFLARRSHVDEALGVVRRHIAVSQEPELKSRLRELLRLQVRIHEIRQERASDDPAFDLALFDFLAEVRTNAVGSFALNAGKARCHDQGETYAGRLTDAEIDLMRAGAHEGRDHDAALLANYFLVTGDYDELVAELNAGNPYAANAYLTYLRQSGDASAAVRACIHGMSADGTIAGTETLT